MSKEDFFSKMHNYMKHADSLSMMHTKLLRDAGRVLFYHSTSSITSLEMIFPAAADSFGFVLAKLGEVCFILVAVFPFIFYQRRLRIGKFPKNKLRL